MVSNRIPKRRLKRKRVDSSIQRSSDGNFDRISCLPDCLLLEILSHLYMGEVVKTSLLSKRWRYLWRSTPCLNFEYLETESEIQKIEFMDKRVAFIDKCLSHHEKNKVRELYICIMYEDKNALSIDSWINFAIMTEVAKFVLDLTGGEFPQVRECKFYKVPHSLFEYGSLITELALSCCDLNLPDSVHLMSLKTLILEHIDLPSDAIERLTSSSPLLEDLFVKSCNRFTNLNITIKNEHVKNLRIEDAFMGVDDFDGEYVSVTVYAPNVLTLKFNSSLPREYHIKNLQSVRSASLGCNDSCPYDGLDTVRYVVEVLNCLHHVKDLELSSSCIQFLSIRKIRNLDPLFIPATSIKLSSQFTKSELPGLAYLLQSASSLENLSVSIAAFPDTEMEDDFMEKLDFVEKRYWDLQESSFSSSALQSIKTISINGFYRSYSVFDTYNCYEPDINRCVVNEIEFVSFLLLKAKALEQMVLNIDKCGRSREKSIKVIKKVSREVVGFDIASPNAKIFVT